MCIDVAVQAAASPACAGALAPRARAPQTRAIQLPDSFDAETVPAAIAGDRLSDATSHNPWTVILGVGGLCWLVLGCAAVIWMLPWSGATTAEGDYVITSRARALEHLMVFVVATLGYRLALALGWPDRALARTRVVVFNVVLVLLVVAWSNIALCLVAGLVDGRMNDMRDEFVALRGLLSVLLNPQQLAHSQALVVDPIEFFLPPYVLGLCAIALVRVTARQHQEALRSAELARAYIAARLAMLSAQLQPHFLFNSLHAAMGLIDENPRQASTMLARLGDFLRHALETSHSPWVDVATELAGLEAYLAVQQMRFADQLSISIDASQEALGLYLPSMLLQPLVENAVEHGRSEHGRTLRLRVSASVAPGHLCIEVSNSSPALPGNLAPSDYGHGLSNVNLRLRAAYGGDAQLVVGPDAHGGTSATLVLPMRHRLGRSCLMGVQA